MAKGTMLQTRPEPGNVSQPALTNADEVSPLCSVQLRSVKAEPNHGRGWQETQAALTDVSPLCYSILFTVHHGDKRALIGNACKQQQPPSEVMNATPDFL